MEYYITKYALTKGILCEECASVGDGYIEPLTSISTERTLCLYKLGHNAFKTHKEAVVKAEEMRLNKIASLKKQLHKLENMWFS